MARVLFRFSGIAGIVLGFSAMACSAASSDDSSSSTYDDEEGTGGGSITTTTEQINPETTSSSSNSTITSTAFALPANAWSHGDPTPKEQALLERIQRARLNPSEEGEIIVNEPSVQSAIDYFDVDTNEVIADFKTYAPAPPLAMDSHLMESSRFHSLDMANNGFQAHDGSAGEEFWERIDATGYNYSFVSENIFAYADSVDYCHAGFLIDWGNPDLGHRVTTLDLDDRKRDIGISIIEDPASSEVGPLVVTEDFGMPMDDSERYIVGVVYTDTDNSKIYDPGEEESGLLVVPDHGSYYAITSSGGGFAIPFSANEGAVTLQLQSADGTVLAEATATLSGENVKVDFVF